MVALLPLSGTEMAFLGVLAHGLFGEHRQRAKRQHERVYFAHTPHLLNRGSHATGLHVHFLTEGACMSLKSNTFAELIKPFLFFFFFALIPLFFFWNGLLYPRKGMHYTDRLIELKISRRVKEPFSGILATL